MTDEPEFEYVIFKKCGCMVGACVDMHDKNTAEFVADSIRDGSHIVERMTREKFMTLVDDKGFGCKCPKMVQERMV